MFDISYFRAKPEPFYVLAKELYPGKYHPTVAHAFIALLAQKDLLHMLFTQNIDCLERRAGVPDEKIVEAHGSFATQRCIECRTEFPDDSMAEHVKDGRVPHCQQPECGGLVKPDIVFFGEKLPERFELNRHAPAAADLVLVMGTSLTVYPFASLPPLAPEGVPRVLFNLEPAGDLGSRADDVMELGSCDDGVRKLADELGWRDELETLWRGVVGDEEAERQLARQPEREIEDEVKKLAEEVDNVLTFHDDDDEFADRDINNGSVTRGVADEEDQDHPQSQADADRDAQHGGGSSPYRFDRPEKSESSSPPGLGGDVVKADEEKKLAS